MNLLLRFTRARKTSIWNLVAVVESQGEILGREALRKEIGETRLLNLSVLPHQIDWDGGVELAQELPASSTGSNELGLELSVDCNPCEVGVALKSALKIERKCFKLLPLN